MPDRKEGDTPARPFSDEPPVTSHRQPPEAGSPLYHDSPEPAGIIAAGPEAGETEDVVLDKEQEPGEDFTANEEEAAHWEPHPRQADVESDRPLQAAATLAPSSPKDQAEEAGESSDVIQDSTQTGQDDTAEHAAERSLKRQAERRQDGSSI